MRLTVIVAAIAAIVGFVAVYASLTLSGNKELKNNVTFEEKPKKIAGDRLRAFLIHKEPKALPAFTFQDRFGASKTLDDFKGKLILLNLWATWCAPCREEMPSLDNLKKLFSSDEFDVLAISMDRGGINKPKKFFEETKLKHLSLYIEPSAKLMFKLKAVGLPATLLIDKEGREVGRLPGPAQWDSDEAINLIRKFLEKS
ncbi:MAG: thioredoxin [Rhodomicrobium sp.]|nr:MAG: thioredoxin [Rhodomicrobium sp.]